VNTLKWLARGSPPISRKSAAFEGQKGGSDAPSLFFPAGNTRLQFHCRREPSLAKHSRVGEAFFLRGVRPRYEWKNGAKYPVINFSSCIDWLINKGSGHILQGAHLATVPQRYIRTLGCSAGSCVGRRTLHPAVLHSVVSVLHVLVALSIRFGPATPHNRVYLRLSDRTRRGKWYMD